jgi:hypothetical protein
VGPTICYSRKNQLLGSFLDSFLHRCPKHYMNFVLTLCTTGLYSLGHHNSTNIFVIPMQNHGKCSDAQIYAAWYIANFSCVIFECRMNKGKMYVLGASTVGYHNSTNIFVIPMQNNGKCSDAQIYAAWYIANFSCVIFECRVNKGKMYVLGASTVVSVWAYALLKLALLACLFLAY